MNFALRRHKVDTKSTKLTQNQHKVHKVDKVDTKWTQFTTIKALRIGTDFIHSRITEAEEGEEDKATETTRCKLILLLILKARTELQRLRDVD
jgi:hypothetical protein